MAQVLPSDSCEVVAVDPDKVALARETIPGLDEAGTLAQLFKLLGDPNRTRILYALLEVGELCVCDLAAVVEVPFAWGGRRPLRQPHAHLLLRVKPTARSMARRQSLRSLVRKRPRMWAPLTSRCPSGLT